MRTGLTGMLNQFLEAHPRMNGQITRSEATGSPGANANGAPASISANDFLTLLVTEMKNQDPTANTDPNEYINQLVQVNSLQQLISINQTLLADSGATASGYAVGPEKQHLDPLPDPVAATAESAMSSQPSPATMTRASGNLSIPDINPSAMRVAEALAGHLRAR